MLASLSEHCREIDDAHLPELGMWSQATPAVRKDPLKMDFRCPRSGTPSSTLSAGEIIDQIRMSSYTAAALTVAKIDTNI